MSHFMSSSPMSISSYSELPDVSQTAWPLIVLDILKRSKALTEYLSAVLQPVPPCVALRESVQVYKEHCRMAREFHQVKHEITTLEDRK